MSDPRHLHRIKVMQDLFSCTFGTGLGTSSDLFDEHDQKVRDTVTAIVKEIPDLDAKIQTAASERALADINKVDLAILRQIVFESNHTKTPAKVLINEGIELAKAFGSENSPKFINGVLAKLLAPKS